MSNFTYSFPDHFSVQSTTTNYRYVLTVAIGYDLILLCPILVGSVVGVA